MQRVVTARQVVAAAMADLLLVHLPAEVATADLLPVVTAVADSDRLVDQPVTAEEDSAAAADSVRPVVDSRLLVDRWVRAWATTSTRRCRSP